MLIKIYIDDVAYEVLDGESILQICEKFGIYIPHLCNLKNTLPSGMCSLCVVEVSGNLVLACKAQARDAMKIVTKSQQLNDIRKNNLFRILRNHNMNCLHCLKAGNCKLQIYASRFGFFSSQQSLEKRNFAKMKSCLNVQQAKIEQLNENIFFEKAQCINCLRCLKFLSGICHVSDINSVEELGKISKLLKFVDITGNLVDICPTSALNACGGVDAVHAGFSEKFSTFDVSSVFTPNILVLKEQDKIVNISNVQSYWIRDDVKFVGKKLAKREEVTGAYGETIEKLAFELTAGSSEKKMFMLGDSIDLLTFLYIRHMARTIDNVVVVIDDQRIPKHMIKDIGFFNPDIAMMDFAIHVGEKFFSDRYYVDNVSNNLIQSVSLRFQDLHKFVDENTKENYHKNSLTNRDLLKSYKFPYLFVYSDFFKKYNAESVLGILQKVQEDYAANFENNLTTKIVPRTLAQIYARYINEYLSVDEMLGEHNMHDTKFVCIVGDICQKRHSYNNIPIIQHSVSKAIAESEHLSSAHFLEEEGFYVNIFGDTIKTKKIVESSFRSNREFVFDLMKAVFGESFVDINEDVKIEMRDIFFREKTT